MFMIYTDSDHVPQAIHETLNTMDNCIGIRLASMLASVVRRLDKAILGNAGSQFDSLEHDDGNPMALDSDQGFAPGEESDSDPASDDVSGSWSPKSPMFEWNQSSASQARVGDRSRVPVERARIRSDLRLAKDAGFRVSFHGSLLDGGREGFVTLSIRVNKLGISSEALQAWHMEPEQYFVLLIRYMEGYQSLDSISGTSDSHASNAIALRAVLNDSYKLGIDELKASFAKSESKSTTKSPRTDSAAESIPVRQLGDLFIARPLDELLNHRFLPVLRYRMAMGFPWRGAEEFFNDHQGRNLNNDAPDPKYWAEDQSDKVTSLPTIVVTDHLACDVQQKSMPLLAMQFALRHLVRCTEFCLVCHCKVEADFEALKPYVCSKPLCLYQYMSLGFGPSIEHEIITQTRVVDLLVSFCYSSASAQKLRHVPTGMALMVPSPYPPSSLDSSLYAGQDPPPASIRSTFLKEDDVHKRLLQRSIYTAKFDPLTRDMLFSPNERPPLQPGSWIVYGPIGAASERYHARVTDVLFPTVRLEEGIANPRNKSSALLSATSISQGRTSGQATARIPTAPRLATAPPSPPIASRSSPFLEIDFVIYDQNFDELDNGDKLRIICMLLDTLPNVEHMKDYLLARGGSHVPLRSWHDRISPSALGILRWIIASNRSCIVQVDSLGDSHRHSEERVYGMPGWMQFRFAQGAPDKEQRFVQSIRKTTSTSQHPTMFAWHGSPLYNWHGIVREGLHFEHADHGRAFGNGVYHALDVSTSLGYSGRGYGAGYGYGTPSSTGIEAGDGMVVPGQWPFSQLKISQALTLNEIVNAPDQFVSKSPHLVVAQLEWIQSRYLFVMCNTPKNQHFDATPSQVLEQDPLYHPVGSVSERLVIPLNAVSKSRRPNAQSLAKKNSDKKRKADEFAIEDVVILSDDTDIEDSMMFVASEEEEESVKPVKQVLAAPKGEGMEKTKLHIQIAHTDFVPASHDENAFPLMEPPSYATSSATRTLQRELTATLKVQDTHLTHELGWYIDRELITNMYQWIIELHSFEPHLPLAKDMKAKNLKSIVLEIRFGKDYPMSPPFVRVIRPRFLSFGQGGGGHITAGGALCMELLTNSGWSAVSNIESVLLQVRLAISSTDPKPARLEPGQVRDYGVGEAVEAYVRACQMHGVRSPSVPLCFRKAERLTCWD